MLSMACLITNNIMLKYLGLGKRPTDKLTD